MEMEAGDKNRELRGSWFRFILFLASIVLAWYGFKAIGYFWKELGLGALSNTQTYSPFQLVILPLCIVEYILAALIFVCFTAWVKKGLSNLRGFGEEGLILGLIVGLSAGLILGLIMGLVVERIIGGLIVGLSAGLITGLMMGLMVEFEKKNNRNAIKN